MKNNKLSLKLMALLLSTFICVAGSFAQKENYTYSDSWGKHGMTLKSTKSTGVRVNFSVSEFALTDQTVGKSTMKTIEMPGNILPNEAGAPDLPGYSKYVAVPNGAVAELEIVSFRKEVIKNVNLAPAPEIPFVGQETKSKLTKNEKIYTKNAFYPETPFQISKKKVIRGVEVVALGVTPFQYNPVTKELVVYRDVEVKVNYKGSKGSYGDARLRSRWFDPILQSTIINYNTLPAANYSKNKADAEKTGYEYVILIPDNDNFKSWADTIKEFRTLQGIKTGVVTISEVGGNDVETIKKYFKNAYDNWDIPPSAVLIMADYGTSGNGITAKRYNHPYSETYITDNYYADVKNNDGLPDIAFARMTARNEGELKVMITKFKNYELNPPTDKDFYNNPITACGWQTERWFQLCSEVVGGYFREVQGKSPIRINDVYSGTPGSRWSTASNTAEVVSYFGPDGLGYIPSTPDVLGNWSGGGANEIINAVNGGSFLLQHRDHGLEEGWGEPYFRNNNINSLDNTDLTFVLSLNCLTGRFDHSSESFAEKFHRYTKNGENSGALGLIAATQVSYSFVNDAFTWGMYDYMWPDFMPDYISTDLNKTPATILPGFANVSGKYFLEQSNWPYNPNSKAITYDLFHLHGDAFTMLYSEVPQELSVSHADTLEAGAVTFEVTADSGSYIALTVDGEILATAVGDETSLEMNIPPQELGSTMIVTVTKQNYYRYSTKVTVYGEPQAPVADFSADVTSLTQGKTVNFKDRSKYLPTSWKWVFEGGTPETSTERNPSVTYESIGEFDVKLIVSNDEGSDEIVKTDFIKVTPVQAPIAAFSISAKEIFVGDEVRFTNKSENDPTSLKWTFEGGSPDTSSAEAPVVTYKKAGTYKVKLVANNIAGSDTVTDSVTVKLEYCTSQGNSNSYEWIAAIKVGDFVNNSEASSYSDFTSKTVPAYDSVEVTLTPGFAGSSYGENWKVWIDFNIDGDFEDENEEVYRGSGSSAVSGMLNIPKEYYGTTTRMRVGMKYGSYPGSCEAFSYGEVEDYTVSIGKPESDVVEEALTVENTASKTEIMVYPNPAKESLNIAITGNIHNATISLLDVSGRLVDTYNMNTELKTISVDKLQRGMYMLVVESEKGIRTISFIKK